MAESPLTTIKDEPDQWAKDGSGNYSRPSIAKQAAKSSKENTDEAMAELSHLMKRAREGDTEQPAEVKEKTENDSS